MSHTQHYIASLQKEYRTNVALEHAYRPAFKQYFEALLPQVQAVNDPQRIKNIGAPDYIIYREQKGEQIPFGYIETKDITVALDKVEKSEQMQRYLKLDNLILTNYLEFRFYRNGEKIAAVTVAELDNFFTQTPSIKGHSEQYARLESLLAEFATFEGQTITSALTLAEMMAKKAQLMRHVFHETLLMPQPSSLRDQMEAFQTMLIHDMDEAQFADVYAQTIAYGLFTARLHDTTLDDFSRAEARDLVPRSNPFLRRLFDYVCGADLDQRVVWIIDALCEIFRATNIPAILKSFGKSTQATDPIIHFYETFLAAYDAKLRKSRGVWYTPEPVVNFIVRAVDEVLQTHFGLKAGIADSSKVSITHDVIDNKAKGGRRSVTQQVHRVQLLDVAAGTGTFTAEAIKQIHAKMQSQLGMWNSYVEEHLLPRLHGFEILMASYAMCHMKIDLLLTELGYVPKDKYNPPRLSVYLTNALEEHHPDAETLFASWLAAEGNEASRIKRDLPIMVAYGNPPYSVSSQNRNKWIEDLIKAYKDGLNERNINPLSDDYIKFIRMSEHYVEKNGHGVVAMITNNSYLDGIIHRQMRLHLLHTFDEIYIYDLHGSAKKKETSPDGSPDKNVFDIQQGVSIIIAVKHRVNNSPLEGESTHVRVLVGGKTTKPPPHASPSGSAAPPQGGSNLATLHHYSAYGARKTKYEELLQHSLKTTPWQRLQPHAPYYFFAPKDFTGNVKYEAGFGLHELFVVNMTGFATEYDDVCVSLNNNLAQQKLLDLQTLTHELFMKKYNIHYDASYNKNCEKILRSIQDVKKNNAEILKTIYRPFDDRFVIYTGYSNGIMGRPRHQIMKHIIEKDNITLLSARTFPNNQHFDRAFISKNIVDCHAASDKTYCFPLYLYPDASTTEDAFATRTPNLHPDIIKKIEEYLGISFVGDDSPLEGESQSVSDAVGGINNKTNRTPHGSASAFSLASPALPQGESIRNRFTSLNLLDYIYAILHSPHYRTTYKEFLKIDFPRIPYPENAETFWQLVALGGQLRSLHLMEHPALNDITTSYPISGDNMVEKVEYKDQRVYINSTQYIEGVPQNAWEFFIGGYQPAQKWLKDRKGEVLLWEDIAHYQRIIAALVNTEQLMQQIDCVIQAV